ncbi:MAG: zinc ribbon domain-containing protein [Rothia sp. (in: high G+C Gram-positive bacteria)]|nr:zinc ribbon domain-containing protein [Rothia sp. (in: high G+C Gram-positive bacteria)]
MPVYVYQCKNCGHLFEKQQTFAEAALKICPQCGQEQLRKKYGNVGVVFKGSGFYKTDSSASPKADSSKSS